MSTTTPGPHKTELEEGIVASTAGHTLQGWLLIVLVFVAGACSLAVEFSASRLLAPYFGTSLFVWANLIGLILLYLTIGYYLGGRLADRFPHPRVLYTLTTVAAFLIGVIPFLARPILSWSLTSFASFSISIFYGSLVSVILLFAIPMILLGCVSPFAIRLRISQLGKSGRTSGQLYAISTAGSIVGTFLPVLWLIPTIGTRDTFFVFAVALLFFSLLGFIVTQFGNGGPRRGMRRPDKSLLSILLLVPMVMAIVSIQGPIKPAGGSDGGGVLLAERESAYNYIQVVRVGDEVQLVLNEGVGVQSVYNPRQVLTGGPWDYFMIAPFFNNPPFTQQQVRRVCIIGLGAGTIAREFSAAYGPIPIDGVEIDPTIVELGREYFNMNEPNLHVIVQDGRAYLQSTSQKYDVIGIDAYQQPYIPFQFTTQEFFAEVRTHLTPTGVAVIDAANVNGDYRLVEALAQTMHAVFPNVYIIDAQSYMSSLVIGTNAVTSFGNFAINTAYLSNGADQSAVSTGRVTAGRVSTGRVSTGRVTARVTPTFQMKYDSLLRTVAFNSIHYGHMREEHMKTVYFTDDRAPIEQLIDAIILDEVERNGR